MDVSPGAQIEVVVDTIEQASWHSQEMPAIIRGPITRESESQHRHHPCVIGKNPKETRVVLPHEARHLIDPLVVRGVLQMEDERLHACAPFIEPRM
jgi:hypothetical protein